MCGAPPTENGSVTGIPVRDSMHRLQLLDEFIQTLANLRIIGSQDQSRPTCFCALLAEGARIESGRARTSLEKSAGRRVIVMLPWEC
jgi:hypothetical protein